MQYKQKTLKPVAAALLLTGSVFSQGSHAALPSSPILNYTSGTNVCLLGGTYPSCTYGLATVKNGSYFAMDLNNIGTFDPGERIATVSAGTGITLGTAQVAGAIDIDWSFASSNGRHLTQNPLTFAATGSANIYDVDMSGWTVNWGAEGDIDMGNGTDAVLTCDTNCSIGENFTLLYTATVPTGAFTGVSYQLSLTGTIGVDNTAPTTSDGNVAAVAAADHSWNADIGDVDGDTLTCTIVTDGASAAIATTCTASALTNNIGTVSGTYTPTGGAAFNGSDSFTFKVNDGLVDSNTSTINVEVAADPAPSCVNLSGTTTSSGTAVNITIDVTDTNVCTDAVGSIVANTLAVSATSANSGTVTVTSGVATYTPPAGFAGTDTFTYTVDDDNGGTSTAATVSVDVVTSSAGAPTSPDGTLACGTTAISVGNTSCVVTLTDIGVADNGSTGGAEQAVAQSCVGGCFDFTITGVTVGTQAQTILPLTAAIPAATAGNQGHRIVYRKLMSTGWQNFDLSTDAIASAPGTVSGPDINCPVASDASYINGMTAGDRCLRVTITDGGPNDADGVANGTVVDPGGIAETFFTSGSDGCSMSNTPINANERADWWLVAAFVGLMGLLTFKRRKA